MMAFPPTFMSFSSLLARAALLPLLLAAPVEGLRASASREAALTLGGVSEEAAQPMATPARPEEEEQGGRGPAARWAWYGAGTADCMGVTAAVGRS